MKRYKRVEYAPSISDLHYLDSNTPSPSVMGAILKTIIASVFAFIVLYTVGPFVDTFLSLYIALPANQGNPYMTTAVSLFQWFYIFVVLSWVVSLILIWRTVFYNIQYEQVI